MEVSLLMIIWGASKSNQLTSECAKLLAGVERESTGRLPNLGCLRPNIRYERHLPGQSSRKVFNLAARIQKKTMLLMDLKFKLSIAFFSRNR